MNIATFLKSTAIVFFRIYPDAILGRVWDESIGTVYVPSMVANRMNLHSEGEDTSLFGTPLDLLFFRKGEHVEKMREAIFEKALYSHSRPLVWVFAPDENIQSLLDKLIGFSDITYFDMHQRNFPKMLKHYELCNVSNRVEARMKPTKEMDLVSIN